MTANDQPESDSLKEGMIWGTVLAIDPLSGTLFLIARSLWKRWKKGAPARAAKKAPTNEELYRQALAAIARSGEGADMQEAMRIAAFEKYMLNQGQP